MQTTLNKIKSHSPCENGWKKLLNYLGKTGADDEVLKLWTILESNGVQDAIWALRAVDGEDMKIRLFAADCAEMVLPIFEKQYPNDDRPRKAIQAARDYANGVISEEELDAARDAAGIAAWDAAGVAARDAAGIAAGIAARDAAGIAAWDAAGVAARDAAGIAAGIAAWVAARDAAGVAAWVAAGVAAEAAWDEIKSLLLKYI